MIKLLKEKFLNRKFILFGLIGLLSTALAQLFYFLLVSWTPLNHGLSSIIGDILPMPTSYVLNAKYTYKEKLNWKAALSFPFAYLPGVIINMLIVIFVVDVLGAPVKLAKLISLPITIPLNFLCVSFLMKITSKKGEKSNEI